MPAAPVGLPIWTPGVWADTVWEDGVWQDESTPGLIPRQPEYHVLMVMPELATLTVTASSGVAYSMTAPEAFQVGASVPHTVRVALSMREVIGV